MRGARTRLGAEILALTVLLQMFSLTVVASPNGTEAPAMAGGLAASARALAPAPDPFYVDSTIIVNPYPLVAGQPAQICVLLDNINSVSPTTFTVEFLASPLGIGLPFNPIAASGNNRTFTVPVGERAQACITLTPKTGGQLALATAITVNGKTSTRYRVVDVAERFQVGMATQITVQVANPTAAFADISLSVQNQCPGWTAAVEPVILTKVAPNSTDIRPVELTLTTPTGVPLGSGCAVDLLASISGGAVGGLRVLDQAPVTLAGAEPYYAAPGIRMPAGQPGQVCADLSNTTAVDQPIMATFSVASFGLGMPFSAIGSATATIPMNSARMVCVPWTQSVARPAFQVRIQQVGYQDVVFRRNRRMIPLNPATVPQTGLRTGEFQVQNPHAMATDLMFLHQHTGLAGLLCDAFADIATGQVFTWGESIPFAAGQTRTFAIIFTPAPGARPAAQAPAAIGDQSYTDVLGYEAGGGPLVTDGLPAALRILLLPSQLDLPLIVRQ